MNRTFHIAALAVVALAAFATTALAPRQANAAACSTILESPFDADYDCNDLGAITGVPTAYGGLTILPSDTNKLIIGGDANDAGGAVYEVTVTRGAGGHITGFSGSASVFADAPYNDGGVVFGPGGVLFLAQWPVNMLGQTKPGSTTTDKTIDMSALGVDSSLAALNFVPAGFPGAGRMKLVSYDTGSFYNATFAADGSGTYNVTAAALTASLDSDSGPEGFTYVPPGSPDFAANSMLLSEYGLGNIVTYTLDANGDPVIGSRVLVMTGLDGAEGATIDPVTGDFLFSTFGEDIDHVVAVSGFAVPPTATATVAPQATSTVRATSTPCIGSDQETPCTPTPATGGVSAATPTRTPTARATSTAVPSAPAPATTPAAPATAPAGLTAGVVTAPNTGTGGSGGGAGRWPLALAIVAVLGILTLGAGARQWKTGHVRRR